MHHLAAVVVMVVVVCVFVGAIVLLTRGIVHRLHAKPGYEAWQGARQELAQGDKLRVVSATRLYRTLDSPALWRSQLAFVHFHQEVIGQLGFLRRSGVRVAFAAIFGIMVVGCLIIAASGRAPWALSLVDAVVMAGLGCHAAYTIPRMVERRQRRLAELRELIESRLAGT